MAPETSKLLAWAKELQAMAAAGIQYTTNDFDREDVYKRQLCRRNLPGGSVG